MVAVCLAISAPFTGCAHRGGAPAPAGPAQAIAGEATRIGAVAYEDDFLEARLVFQALPAAAPERAALRSKLLHYLLDPVLALKVDQIRRETRDLESDDLYDTVFASFRDALGLFDPSEIWASPPRMTAAETALIRPTAEMVLALFSPRGGEQQAVLALAALATLDPGQAQWADRLDQVVRWTEEEATFDEGGGPHRNASASDALESALGDWPAPAIVKRLDALYVGRQKRLSSVLHQPPRNDSARRALSELLLAHGDEIQRAVTSMAGIYLRAGRIADAASRAAAIAGGDGDDPELRGLLSAAAKPGASAGDMLALARLGEALLQRVRLGVSGRVALRIQAQAQAQEIELDQLGRHAAGHVARRRRVLEDQLRFLQPPDGQEVRRQQARHVPRQDQQIGVAGVRGQAGL